MLSAFTDVKHEGCLPLSMWCIWRTWGLFSTHDRSVFFYPFLSAEHWSEKYTGCTCIWPVCETKRLLFSSFVFASPFLTCMLFFFFIFLCVQFVFGFVETSALNFFFFFFYSSTFMTSTFFLWQYPRRLTLFFSSHSLFSSHLRSLFSPFI